MPKHELHNYADCPATIAWQRGDDYVHCSLIAVAALLSRQEFNDFPWEKRGLEEPNKHYRVNDEHCENDLTAGNVVVEGLRGYSGMEYDYEIFRPTPDCLNPWEQITKEN